MNVDSSQILQDGGMGYSSDLALFTLPTSNVGTESIKYVKYRASNDINNGDGTVEFRIPASGMAYTDLRRTRLYVKCKIVQKDGSPLPDYLDHADIIPDEARCGPSNLLLHSMWKQVEIYVNGKLITNSNSDYQYKAYMKTLLGYSAGAKTSQLQNQLFYKDTAFYVDDSDNFSGGNAGLVERSQMFKNSREVEMVGPILEACMQLDRYLLNSTEIKIRLYPTSNAFRLMSPVSDPSFKLILTDVYLNACHVTPAPSVVLAHQEALKEPGALAHYAYMNEEIRAYSIPKGSYQIELDDMWTGMIPSTLTLAMVSAASYSGQYHLSPYNFKNYDTNFVSCTINGTEAPIGFYNANFKDDQYSDLYQSLFQGKHIEDMNVGIDISRSEYPAGYTIMMFDLQPQCADAQEGFWPLKQSGNLRLSLRFQKELPETVTLLAMATYPSLFSMDQSRNVVKQN